MNDKGPFYFDGDFRRQPKTHFFCAVCQRDLKPGLSVQYIFLGDPCDHAVALTELTGNELKKPVGPECAGKIPDEYKTGGQP